MSFRNEAFPLGALPRRARAKSFSFPSLALPLPENPMLWAVAAEVVL